MLDHVVLAGGHEVGKCWRIQRCWLDSGYTLMRYIFLREGGLPVSDAWPWRPCR